MNFVEQIEATLGIASGSLASLVADGELSDDGAKVLKESFDEKFKQIKKAGYDEGHGRDKREVLSQRDKQLAEKYGLDKSLDVEGIIEAILTKERESIKTNPDDVKKSDVFKAAIKQKTDEIESLRKQIDDVRGEAHRSMVENTLFSTLPDKLQSLGFAIPESAERKDRFIKMLVEDLRSGDVSVRVENRNIVFTDRDGNPLKDAAYNPVTLDDRIKQFAPSIFDKATDPPRQSPGGKQPEPGNGTVGKFTFSRPATAEEFMNKLDSIKDLEEAKAYQEFYSGLK